MRGAAGTGGRAAVALVVAALVAGALPAGVEAQASAPPPQRLSGPDRFATAAAVSAATFEPGAAVVYVATGESFPDALAGGPLAGARGAPILLTSRGALPAATAAEFERLDPAAITVLGGPAAVADGVLTALDAFTDGPVQRLAGASRFSTAAAISAEGFADGAETAYVATGDNFPDALAGGAAGATTGRPVLLTSRGSLPAETRAELERLAPETILVLGGSAAVSDDVLAALQDLAGGDVRRLSGADRFATAAAIAADTFPATAPAVFLATGGGFPDALAGAPAAAAAGGPLLLVQSDCAPAATVAAVERLAPERLVVLGGSVAVSDAAAALQPCGGVPPPPPPPPGAVPPPTFTVDASLEPAVDSLPPLEEGGAPRPVARLVDELGSELDFVESELLVATDDRAELDGVIDRWQGELLATVELPGDAPDVHLLKVDAAAADVAGIGAGSQAIDPLSRGAHRVSSEAALDLLAAGTAEAAGGVDVGLNAVTRPQGYLERSTTEAPTGQSTPGLGYAPNPYTWTYMNSGSPQDIGVGDAWRMLALGQRLGNRVRVAVIDGGFAVANPDYPPGTAGSGATNPSSCTGGSPCPWHGTGSAQTVGGVPDNGQGTAGSGGPIADLTLLDTDLGMFSVIGGLLAASVLDARVITMSFGLQFPATVSWASIPLDVAAAVVAGQGRLLFAAAGNDGADVDAEDCFFACWEETFHAPCEEDGVTCVGGLAPNTRNRAPGSNYGRESCENPDCAVRIFGPFTVFIGDDPNNTGNVARVSSGTSVSTPFVAGVAALVWAANPQLAAGDVLATLIDTAGPSPDGNVSRIVNARAAVQRAIGNTPPGVTITGPADGTTVPYGTGVSITTVADDYEDGTPCCLVRFASDRGEDQLFGSSGTGLLTPRSPGPRRITATATDSAGAVGPPAGITINATNTPPQVAIQQQAPNASLFQGVPYPYRGTITDENEGDGIGCDALEWSVLPANAGAPQRGCRPRIAIQAPGVHSVTLTGTDETGATASRSVLVDVRAIPPNSPPVVVIYNPANGDRLQAGVEFTLEGEAFLEPGENSPLGYRWVVTDHRGVTEIATTPTVQYRCATPGVGIFEQTFTLQATDDDGTGTAAVTVECSRGPN